MRGSKRSAAGLQSLLAVATFATALGGWLANVHAADAGAINFTPDETNKCLQESKRQKTEARNRVYDKAFRHYVEICAASTWQMRGASDGGNYGHAFASIRGACVVKDANGQPVVPPQIEYCKDGYVGISSDYIFNSVQWTAVEGRNFFLYGDLPAGEALDQATADRLKEAANARGMFNGVRFAKGYEEEIAREGAKKGLSAEAFRPMWQGTASLGTDFALAAARGGVDCTRIPLWGTKAGQEDKPLKDLIAYLNERNRIAYQSASTGGPGFDYDGAVNNCTSNFSNALANLGFWPVRDTSGHPDFSLSSISSVREFAFRANDVSVPYNDMFAAYKIGSNFDLEGTIRALRADQRAFAYFKQSGWLKTQAGTMIESIPPMAYMNSVYDTSNNTNFASVVYEAQKKLIASLRSSPFIHNSLMFVLNTGVGSFVKEKLSDLWGIDLANLKAVPPRDMTEFKKIRADETHVGTNLVSNLKWWRDLYTRYLSDLNSGSFGNDEVVAEMRDYLSKRVNHVNALLMSESKLIPELAPACPN